MSTRTTVALDEDVLERVKEESRTRGASFRDTLNDLLRVALTAQTRPPFKRTLKIKPRNMGLKPGLNYDDVEALIEYAEGPYHR
jgi:hypothetical protein